jgi:hypothetical protein
LSFQYERFLKRRDFFVGSDFAMPQPIPRGKQISFSFGRRAVLERPKLAPYIAAILMHWNEIESRMGIFLAALLGGESQTVTGEIPPRPLARDDVGG